MKIRSSSKAGTATPSKTNRKGGENKPVSSRRLESASSKGHDTHSKTAMQARTEQKEQRVQRFQSHGELPPQVQRSKTQSDLQRNQIHQQFDSPKHSPIGLDTINLTADSSEGSSPIGLDTINLTADSSEGSSPIGLDTINRSTASEKSPLTLGLDTLSEEVSPSTIGLDTINRNDRTTPSPTDLDTNHQNLVLDIIEQTARASARSRSAERLDHENPTTEHPANSE